MAVISKIPNLSFHFWLWKKA